MRWLVRPRLVLSSEDVFARYLPSRSVSTRELVLGPEKSGETGDFELVISNPDHEFGKANIPNNSGRLHEFTSSKPLADGVGMFRGKNAPVDGENEATAIPPVLEGDDKPVWTGRAVL